jgi:hypothetical protein
MSAAWYRRETMIPYDDLVAALQQWRARQGLPVSTMGGGGTAAAPQPGSGPHGQAGSGPYGQTGSGPYGQAGSGPYGQPGSGPTRGAPPAPPRGKQPSIPPPLAAGDDGMHEVDDAEMLEEQYETEGSDFAMGFGNPTDDSTAIGGAPERPTDPNDFNGGRGGGGRDDW